MPARKLKKVDHIDPLKNEFICGFDSELNTISADLSYNKAKSNAFVPYRIKNYAPPIKFGDTCEFLIQDSWIVCKFGSNRWWKEATRIGYSRTNTRGTIWCHDPETGEERMLSPKDALKNGYVPGRLNHQPSFPEVSPVKGKKSFYNKVTGEHRYFDFNPDPSLWERGLPQKMRIKMSESGLNRPFRVESLLRNEQDIIDLYCKGMSTTHLALLFNANHKSIANYLKKWGVELRPRSSNKEQRELSKKLYKEQCTLQN
jgi:hypothetical protein